jgi:hypothetical protein
MGIRLSSLALAATAAAAVDVPAGATIMSDCYAINGNGYAWSTTLSYLSEALSVQARQAREEEAKSGNPVFVHQACLTGGSSGSAVVGVWQNLLKNDNIVSSEGYEIDLQVNNVALGPSRVYTPDELENLSKAMRFVALGVDFTTLEVGEFLPPYGIETLLGKTIDDNGDIVDLSPNVPNWWKENSDPYTAQVLFTQKALVARNVRPEDWDVSVRTAIYTSPGTWWDFMSFDSEQLTNVAQQNAGSNALSILDDVPDVDDVDKVEILKRLGQWARAAGNTVNQRAYSEGKSESPWNDRIKLPTNIETNSTLNTMLKENIDNGLCTITFSVLFDNQAALDANGDAKPAYEQARPVLACNKKTIEVILNSEAYQNDLKAEFGDPNNDAPISRFVLVTVTRYYDALNFGIREPTMFRTLSGGMNELGMSMYYDPKKDFVDNREPQFTLVDTNGAIKPVIAVLGGYPTSNMSGLIQSYYSRGLFEALKVKVSDGNGKAFARHNRFQKGGAFPLFAFKVIDTILSGDDPEVATANRAKYAVFDAVYDKKVPAEFADSSDSVHKILSNPTKIDWNLESSNPLPAALAGTSFMLTPRSIRQTREFLDGDYTYRKPVYVPGQASIEKFETAMLRTDKKPLIPV